MLFGGLNKVKFNSISTAIASLGSKVTNKTVHNWINSDSSKRHISPGSGSGYYSVRRFFR